MTGSPIFSLTFTNKKTAKLNYHMSIKKNWNNLELITKN